MRIVRSDRILETVESRRVRFVESEQHGLSEKVSDHITIVRFVFVTFIVIRDLFQTYAIDYNSLESHAVSI
ncbi:MAG: hypothetical protein ACMXYM_00210 [Candidatus Woesearchaeota archaeon]